MKKKVKVGMKLVVLAIVLTFTVIMATPSAEAAKKVTVKKVSITKPGTKTIRLAKGKKYTMQVTVKTTSSKGTYKKVKYMSNHPNVVGVSQKGVLVAKNIGTAQIKVSSKKNSKKKATLNVVVVASTIVDVTVNDMVNTPSTPKPTYVPTSTSTPKPTYVPTSTSTPKPTYVPTSTSTPKPTNMPIPTCTPNPDATKIISTSILSEYSMQVVLSKANSFSKIDFVVGASATKYSPVKVTTTDNINYILYFDREFYAYNVVSLTINSSNGVLESTCHYYGSIRLGEIYVAAQVGVPVYTSVGTGNDWGKCKLSLSGELPEGIVMGMVDSYICFSGTPVRSVENYQLVLTVTDELGRTQSTPVSFSVGDNMNLAVSNRVFKTENSQSFNETIEVNGGSGQYAFEIISDEIPEGISITSNLNKICIDGNYDESVTMQVQVKVMDTSNEAVSKIVTVIFEVQSTRIVSGVVKNSQGNVEKGYTVLLNGEDTYCLTPTDENGVYEFDVLPGTYHLFISYANKNEYIDMITVGDADLKNVDICLNDANIISLDVTEPTNADVYTWLSTGAYMEKNLTDTIKEDENFFHGEKLELENGTYYIYYEIGGYDKNYNLVAVYTQHIEIKVDDGNQVISLNNFIKDTSMFTLNYSMKAPTGAENGTLHVQLMDKTRNTTEDAFVNGSSLKSGTYSLIATYTTANAVYTQIKSFNIYMNNSTIEFKASGWTNITN